MLFHSFPHFPFIIAEVVALEYENKRHFQSALMRSDRNKFVESDGGDDAKNGGGEEAEGAHAHTNGTAGSNFDAPRTPIVFMLGEPHSSWTPGCQKAKKVSIPSIIRFQTLSKHFVGILGQPPIHYKRLFTQYQGYWRRPDMLCNVRKLSDMRSNPVLCWAIDSSF